MENNPKYICSVCNYDFDPDYGDVEAGVEPGIVFDDLPEGWTCPECGGNKGMFTNTSR
jgi:rubredoxin